MGDFYTMECVGCLACESACPAKVPYGELLYEARHAQVARGGRVHPLLRLTGALLHYTRFFDVLNLPLRLARRLGLARHRFLFPGRPEIFKSTASYAREVVERLQPKGSRVALLSGCLMEGVFREINYATVRVLAVNGVRVEVPEGQACCGAVFEHAGLPGQQSLDARNRGAFAGFETVITNAAGCGLALSHVLPGRTRDLLSFLGTLKLKQGQPLDLDHLYFDIPCHLYHGLKVQKAPPGIFEAIGTPWSYAPEADRCCGSGGTYNITHAHNSRRILEEKSRFLNDVPHARPALVTANHVCMMQWHSAVATGLVRRKVPVLHLVQALDESCRRAGLYAALGA